MHHSMIKALTFFTCLALMSAKNMRIRNGRRVSMTELNNSFSFIVSVYFCVGRRKCSTCTGSLINATTVLLSAHCFCFMRHVKSRQIIVFFKTIIANRGRWVFAHQGKRKPYICNRRKYQADIDIATLTLDTPIRDIQPVQLECSRVPIAQRVTMIGFGKDDARRSGTLRIGQRKTMHCELNQPGAICVNGNFATLTSVGHGDSGGPLLIAKGSRYVQIGVTSGAMKTVYNFGLFKWLGRTLLWTRVGAHCAWIRS